MVIVLWLKWSIWLCWLVRQTYTHIRTHKKQSFTHTPILKNTHTHTHQVTPLHSRPKCYWLVFQVSFFTLTANWECSVCVCVRCTDRIIAYWGMVIEKQYIIRKNTISVCQCVLLCYVVRCCAMLRNALLYSATYQFSIFHVFRLIYFLKLSPLSDLCSAQRVACLFALCKKQEHHCSDEIPAGWKLDTQER